MHFLLAVLFAGLLNTPSVDLIPVAHADEPPLALVEPLRPICGCESSASGKQTGEPRQYGEDGNVLHGAVHYDDIGYCQLNNDVWGEQATKLGYDIYTKEGNIRMTNWIFSKRGTRDWYSSRSCWDK